MSTVPPVKAALQDGLPANDSPDDLSEGGNKFHCPGCGKSYQIVPDEAPETAEPESGPMSDADIIESYGRK